MVIKAGDTVRVKSSVTDDELKHIGLSNRIEFTKLRGALYVVRGVSGKFIYVKSPQFNFLYKDMVELVNETDTTVSKKLVYETAKKWWGDAPTRNVCKESMYDILNELGIDWESYEKKWWQDYTTQTGDVIRPKGWNVALIHNSTEEWTVVSHSNPPDTFDNFEYAFKELLNRCIEPVAHWGKEKFDFKTIY